MADTALLSQALTQLTPPEPSGIRAMLGVTGAFLPLATFCVLLRIWVKLKMIKSWGWDDWAILATLIFFYAESGVLISIALTERAGVANLANGETIALLVPAEQSLYIAGTISLKLSLAIYYLRFLRVPWQRQTILISTVLYAAFAVALIFLVTFECGVPSRQNMIKTYTPGACVPFSVYSRIAIAHAVANSLTDFIFTLLPISVLWTSFLPLPTKLSACAVVALALGGSVASCVRTSCIPGLKPSMDFYVHSAPALVWTAVEPALGICAACLATLRPLLRKCAEGARSGLHSSNSKGQGKSGRGGQDTDNVSKSGRRGEGIVVTEFMSSGSMRMGSTYGDADGKAPWDDFRKFGFDDHDDEMGLRAGGRSKVGTVTTIVGNAPPPTPAEEMHGHELQDWKGILQG